MSHYSFHRAIPNIDVSRATCMANLTNSSKRVTGTYTPTIVGFATRITPKETPNEKKDTQARDLLRVRLHTQRLEERMLHLHLPQLEVSRRFVNLQSTQGLRVCRTKQRVCKGIPKYILRVEGYGCGSVSTRASKTERGFDSPVYPRRENPVHRITNCSKRKQHRVTISIKVIVGVVSMQW